MNKETKYKKTYDLKATIFSALFLVVFTIILIYFLFNANNLLEILVYILLLSFIFFSLIGVLIGFLKGKMQILKEDKYLQNINPYIYYRDLPNNFGIGVTSLLYNSTIENYKDIVAVILDLCTKKYLSLIKENDKYIIKVLKNIDSNLLSNEKYILSLIINNNLKNINYQEWYNYCLQDGLDLGLYYPRNIKLNSNLTSIQIKMKKRNKLYLTISIVISVLVFCLSLPDNNICKSIGSGIFSFILTYIIFLVQLYFLNIFTSFKSIAKQVGDINYKNIIENNLQKTPKGIEELHKLHSFKAFLEDFGSFTNKKAQEVILWDRYLSYAQVFGLTKEIMQSGYKELVDNSAFQIDNIDNINLYNIEIN